VSLHTNRHHQQAGDGRSSETVALAERELTLPDPVEPAELLHPASAHWCKQFRQSLAGSLAPWRRDIPILIPDVHQLRPMLWACAGGHNQSFDNSPAWRAVFGTADLTMQGYVRSLWQSVREVKFPAPAQHEALVNALAAFIIDVFKQAAEQQRARLEKAEAERGPVPRAQSAAALLEQLPTFTAALDAYVAATRDTSFNGELRGELERLQRALRRELS